MILSETVTYPRTIKTFIELKEACNDIHNNKYDYSKFIFYNMKEKSIIICPIHGEFLQDMSKHKLAKQGCPKCDPSYKLTKEEVINRAKAIYGDTYDYLEMEYKNTSSKVSIKCNKHNIYFEQTMECHLSGAGCTECISEKRRSNTSEFIAKARKIHGDIYDYSKSEYIGVQKKLTIICNKHGEFHQIPNTHLSGGGCRKCSAERNSYNTTNIIERFKDTPTTFYVIEYKDRIKIGITVQDVKIRYRNDVDNIDDIRILHQQEFSSYEAALNFETLLKNKYSQFRYFGKKLFKHTGNTEVYDLNVFELYLSEI